MTRSFVIESTIARSPVIFLVISAIIVKVVTTFNFSALDTSDRSTVRDKKTKRLALIILVIV